MDHVLWISGRADTQLSHNRAVVNFQVATNAIIF